MTSNEMVNQLNKLLQQSIVSNSNQKVRPFQRNSLVNQQNTLPQFNSAFILNNQKIKTRQSSKKDSNSEIAKSGTKNNLKYFMINGKYGEKMCINGKSNEFEENKENTQKIQQESPQNMNVLIKHKCQSSEKFEVFKQLINQIHFKNKEK
ncbi:unnamed protein product (macronuclear) [Paramecium tetraurelia]|uniref:Uncharacterized protein n=1 Tax=Paramecium tetraurelia TaxID=5888 RepID=A0BCT4_PARTE|nr:uncharacterized protein GSPATT00004445001 [Paramecium tetraurelia]CAK56351.1 unnamed protein product [Paramecium tetraurelia]|eukprot:XP_001423749.1 hypothetical protein (macronuclear) [Paramecium tetraurelia strain d4-2]